MPDAKLCWITRDEPLDYLARIALFDAAPVPVERRRCVTHDAEEWIYPKTQQGSGVCWRARFGVGGVQGPCNLASVFEVPASPSDATSETTT